MDFPVELSQEGGVSGRNVVLAIDGTAYILSANLQRKLRLLVRKRIFRIDNNGAESICPYKD